jgi:hypothetical protein
LPEVQCITTPPGQAFAPDKYNRSAALCRQSRQEYHGECGRPKEGCEYSSTRLRFLVWQHRDCAAFFQCPVQHADSPSVGRYIISSSAATSLIHQAIKIRHTQWPVQASDVKARSTIQACGLPCAQMRCCQNCSPACSDCVLDVFQAVNMTYQLQDGGCRAQPERAGFQDRFPGFLQAATHQPPLPCGCVIRQAQRYILFRYLSHLSRKQPECQPQKATEHVGDWQWQICAYL